VRVSLRSPLTSFMKCGEEEATEGKELFEKKVYTRGDRGRAGNIRYRTYSTRRLSDFGREDLGGLEKVSVRPF